MTSKNWKKPVIVFLSSSLTNLAYETSKKFPNIEFFLILDRKIPIDTGETLLDNFDIQYFDKDKIYEKNKDQYFDALAMQLLDFEPDLIICSNYYKLLPKSFIDFVNFRNSSAQIINIHHADLRINNELNEMKYSGLQAWKKQFREEKLFLTTIHIIEDEYIDTGKQICYSEPTTLKELQNLDLVSQISEIKSLRVCNVILHYHEQSKVLNLLCETIKRILKLT